MDPSAAKQFLDNGSQQNLHPRTQLNTPGADIVTFQCTKVTVLNLVILLPKMKLYVEDRRMSVSVLYTKYLNL